MQRQGGEVTRPVNRPLPLNGPTKLRFWHFNQNNSGGSFVQDHKSGLSHHVIIEAESEQQANEIAQTKGIYFNGCASGDDCSCCGDRWYEAYGNGDEVPTIYSQPICLTTNTYKSDYGSWMEDGIEAYVHFFDGRIVPIKAQKKAEAK